MLDLTDGDRYLDRHGDTWEVRAAGTHLRHVARADEGDNPDADCLRWYETADTVIRDFGPMAPLS